MNVALFDLYTRGHHLPYAARTKDAIEAVSEHDVKFLTLAETPRIVDLFGRDDIICLEDPDSPRIEDRERGFDEIAEEVIADFFSNINEYQIDVLHFLFADDILGPIYRHSDTANRPRLIGELNGVFFKRNLPLRGRYSHPLFLTLLQTPIGHLIDLAVPEYTDHEQGWRDLFLYRCVNEYTFDRLIVHSDEASEYVSRLNPETPIEQVPYPAPRDFGAEISKQEARDRLNIASDENILLFFGTLRMAKGVDRLLRVLREYTGPDFTMYIAGPPIDVSKEQVRAVRDASKLKIITELTYIDNPETYYRAADAIVLPYTRKFGRECTSQTLDEASSSHLPVIVPAFGAIGRLTEEWQLGTTYEPESDEALEDALRQFAREGVSHSEEGMKRYNRLHSHESTATQLAGIYNGE